MADIFIDFKRRFDAASIAAKYIYINVGIFIILRLLIFFMKLFMKEAPFLEFLGTPSDIGLLLYRPWTIITYMFVHFDILHILINMLWLYWFGKIFLQFFTGRQLGGLYLLGGIAGAALYLITYNLFPYLRLYSPVSFLVGASASVMAIVFAVSFYQKNYTINLLLIGQVKLIYVAIGVFLLDVIAVSSDENIGGHIAHIGGALLGIFFAAQYQKGKDFTRFMNKVIDQLVNIFTKKPVFKIHRSKKKFTQQEKQQAHARPETDDAYMRRKNEEMRVIDDILDKLKRSGYDSLSADEKKKLFDASRR